MKIFELPLSIRAINELSNEGGAYADPLVDITEVVQHYDDRCIRIMSFHAYAPETNAFMFQLQRHGILIKMCPCNMEATDRADWSYNFE